MSRTTEVKIKPNQTTGPTISRDNGDHVMWSSKGGAYTVCFRNKVTPFDKHRFVVPTGGSVDSGAVRGNADLQGYDYDIFDGVVECPKPVTESSEAQAAIDPTIFVDP